MRLRATLLLSMASLGLTGCQIGSLRALGEDWPIRRIPPSPPAPWVERGGGAGGALVRTGGGRYRVVTSEGQERLRESADLAGAQLSGRFLYRVVGEEVRRERWDGGELERSVVVARIVGARDVSVDPGRSSDYAHDDVVLVSGDGAVYVATKTDPARVLWTGDALAVALDPTRKVAWIAGAAPLPVIDAVDLETGEVRVRVPLPLELETPSLQLVVGPRALIAYAHDRPIASALLVVPEAGLALPLRPRDGALPGRADTDALPALIVPPGVIDGVSERLSFGGDPGDSFGRLALLPDGDFLLVEDGRDGLRVAKLGVPGAPDAALRQSVVTPPREWSGRVEAVGWDEDGAFVVSSRDVLRFGRKSEQDLTACRQEGSFGRGIGGAVRVGANYVVGGLVFVVEATTAIALNTAISTLAVPLGPIVFFGHPPAGIAMTFAPVWWPVAHAFDID